MPTRPSRAGKEPARAAYLRSHAAALAAADEAGFFEAVRVETGDDGAEYGLFSTTYVEPSARRQGVARHLLVRGETWMIEQGMPRAVTWTSPTNHRLIALYQKEGYRLRPGLMAADGESPMVELSRGLPIGAASATGGERCEP